MSVLNQSGEEQVECPLCMEPFEVDDLHFYPCTCGYQICRFCWNRIREGDTGLCPACRKAYPENPADFTPLSQEQVAAMKTEKKAREQKRRNKTLESRRALANVRVVQNNLVFVVGLPVRLADPEILKRQEYFGKYGKIHKVVINQSTTYAGSQGPSASAYVTYVSSADALRAIQGVNNVTLDGRVLKSSLGTTKYCANFMKNQPCPKADCMYLHELGDSNASFTKEEMHAGLHQVYERKLHCQLLSSQREKPDERNNNPGNSSNFVPTTVVTSSHINVSNPAKSKKEGTFIGEGSTINNNTKEAWPSLGSSPPSESPARKQPSPKPSQSTVKSHECSATESTSTQLAHIQSQAKNAKDTNETDSGKAGKSKDINGQKKSKTDSKKKCSNSNSEINEIESTESYKQTDETSETNTLLETDTQTHLSDELDELENERHNLLENHDLLENNEHSLLEDDNTYNLLNETNNESLKMQRQNREIMSNYVDSNSLLPQIKQNRLVNGYVLTDRDAMNFMNDDRISQINKGLLEKEMMLRERSHSEMIMRQNELLARHQMVEPKHYIQPSSVRIEPASEILGANSYTNVNMLPPFGMRLENSMSANSISNALSANSLGNSLKNSQMTANNLTGGPIPMSSRNTISRNTLLGGTAMNLNTLPVGSMSVNNLTGNLSSNMLGGASTMSANSLVGNPLVGNSIGGGYMMQNHQLIQNQQLQSGLVNGFSNLHSAHEGRYLAENMDKFFTDFHKAQQMRLMVSRAASEDRRYAPRQLPSNVVSAASLEMENRQRLNNVGGMEASGLRASGDCDDDLDFDPFKETQKALAEMIESEMMQNSGDSMDYLRRSRLPPPGFSHVNTSYGMPPQSHHQGINTNSSVYSDWTQMDPAIVSTSVNFGKGAQPQMSLNQQQQELFARFNQLQIQPNGVNKLQVPLVHQQWQASQAQKLPWAGVPQYNNIPLPPGFAPTKTAQHPAECIDAK